MGTFGMWTLSQKCDCERYRNVVTIAKMRLSALSDRGDYRNADIFVEKRLWALSECGLYRKNTIVGAIGMWSLSQKCDCGPYRIVGTIGMWAPGVLRAPSAWSPQNLVEPAKLPGTNPGARKTPRDESWSPQNSWMEPAKPLEPTFR